MFNKIKITLYTILVLATFYAGTVEYLKWLNPLDLKPEANPKQHDGSQEFNPHQEWKSSIQPAPDEEGVIRYLDPWELHQHGKEEEIVYTPQTEELTFDE